MGNRLRRLRNGNNQPIEEHDLRKTRAYLTRVDNFTDPLTLYQTTNFTPFQNEKGCTILSLMKMDESSPKKLENPVEKGDIARHE